MGFESFYQEIGDLLPEDKRYIRLVTGRKPNLDNMHAMDATRPLKEQLAAKFKGRTLAEIPVDNDTLLLVDKIAPHSVTDLMLVAATQTPQSTFADISEGMATKALQTIRAFVLYATSEETRKQFHMDKHFLRVVLNTDADTQDRYSLQSEKQFHPQLICYPPLEDELIRVHELDFSRPDALLAESQDPLAILSGHLLDDLVFSDDAPFGHPLYNELFEVVPFHPDSLLKKSLPLAYVLKLRNSWEALQDPRMGVAMKQLHNSLSQSYRLVRQWFTGEGEIHPIPWQRPFLLPKAEIASRIEHDQAMLSEDSIHGLTLLSQTLQNVSPKAMKYFLRNNQHLKVGLAEQTITLANTAYSLTWFSPGNLKDSRSDTGWADTYMAIQPMFMRPIGAGGAGYDPDGRMFRVTRLGNTAIPLHQTEIETRKAFQGGFINHLLDSEQQNSI